MVDMGEGNGSPTSSALVRVPSRAVQPSWGRVLATTVRLSAVRRWRPAAAVLAAALTVVAALWLSGVLTGSAAPAARSAPAGRTGTGDASGPGPAAAFRSRAAAWIAAQVSTSVVIACYPAMCTALQVQGVTPGQLMPLRSASASPVGAEVLVTSSSGPDSVSRQYAPALVASFGSGGARIEVRATEPGGPAAYQAALRADLAARGSAGAQLLRNRNIQFTAREARQLRAGEVDSRLLATLAVLGGQHAFRVTAFGDAAPGVPLLFRGVTIAGRGNGAADLAAIAALAQAQVAPYRPARVTLVPPAAGRTAVIIGFAAPSPLGLLTPALR
jgi:hypothetical protein